MLLFVGQWIRGLILGWVVALIFYLVKRLLARAFGQMNQPVDIQKSKDESSDIFEVRGHQPRDQNVVETIWVGMTASQLIAAFGHPQRTEKKGPQDIWVYTNITGHGAETAISLDQNRVSDWQNRA
jgi:hypothetical protein